MRDGHNFERHYVLQLVRRILSKMLQNFTIFLALKLMDSGAPPTYQGQHLVEVSFDRIQFIK